MTVVTIPRQEEFLLDLFLKVPDEGLILQTTDGKQFILSEFDGWHGFDVAFSNDFEQEVKATAENQELAAFIKEERPRTKERLSLAQVKQELGLY